MSAAPSTDAALARADLAARLIDSGALAVPPSLPVADHVEELLGAIRDHQVVVVAGETGSGKSTQLPKLCLQLGLGVDGLIGHTQPRRVAARAIAERLAEETGTELGDAIGYAVRFTDRVGPRALVKVMTDGILLAEIQRDRLLRRYQVLIIDEAHERSLNVDFLLGYLTRLLVQRPDLKLIVTSATIDTERFARHFGGAPVVQVSGRAHPVEIRYRPFGEEPDDDRDQVTAICDAVDELRREGPGDVLVFLSGEREIHDTADALRRLQRPGTEVLALYARLSAAEQHRIFQPHRARRVVLATNVAETSITVPGVRYVVDAGSARISRYSLRLKVQRLPIEPVSQASANQRAGRCGRLGPGICIRLYTEADFASRPAFTEPEILRTNLASVILQMTALRLGDVADFPFIEAPDRRAVRAGYALLEELGALHPDEPGRQRRLTRIGRHLARLPVDPRLGRMVLESGHHGSVREVLVIAAALSIPDPRERPADRRQAADEMHRRFATDGSDLLALVRLWDHLRASQRELSTNQFRKLCRTEFLNYLRVREWQDLYSQLRHAAADLGVRHGATDAHPDRVHQAVMAGLLSHLGIRDGDSREYRGAHGSRFAIAPGSAVGKATPRWVMAGELVETSRLWARMVAPIRPEWAEAVAPDLVKRSYGEPRWERQRGAAVVTERVSLFGLPIVVGRAIGLDRIDPPLARQMFIRHAFVEGDTDEAWSRRQTFLARNAELIASIEHGRQRHRQAVAVDDQAVISFYDQRIPPDVVSTRHFDTWWKRARAATPDLLVMTAESLGGVRLPAADEFPTRWTAGDLALAVTYRFDPGAADDGATVHVPVEVLAQLDPAPLTWSVPGFRDQLVDAAVRGLPKDARRELSPLAETAAAVSAHLRGQAPTTGLADAISEAVLATRGVRVEPWEVSLDGAAGHLRLGFAVEDGQGRLLAWGKDLGELQGRLAGVARRAVAAATAVDERRGMTTWAVGALEREVTTTNAGRAVRGYPALVDDGDSVSLRVFSTAAVQARVMHGGVRRLVLLALALNRPAIERRLSNRQRLDVVGAGLDLGAVIEDCAVAAIDRVLAGHGLPWDERSFADLVAASKAEVPDAVNAGVASVAGLAARHGRITRRLDDLVAPALQPAVADVRAQLRRLIRPGFVAAAGLRRLADVDRYLQAIEHRLGRIGEHAARDRQQMADLQAIERRYTAVLATLGRGPVPAEVIDLGWQLEELRVATFAQQVGATKGVSVTRVVRALAQLEAPGRRT